MNEGCFGFRISEAKFFWGYILMYVGVICCSLAAAMAPYMAGSLQAAAEEILALSEEMAGTTEGRAVTYTAKGEDAGTQATLSSNLLRDRLLNTESPYPSEVLEPQHKIIEEFVTTKPMMREV